VTVISCDSRTTTVNPLKGRQSRSCHEPTQLPMTCRNFCLFLPSHARLIVGSRIRLGILFQKVRRRKHIRWLQAGILGADGRGEHDHKFSQRKLSEFQLARSDPLVGAGLGVRQGEAHTKRRSRDTGHKAAHLARQFLNERALNPSNINRTGSYVVAERSNHSFSQAT
jgi:hypothetical protein